MDSYAGCSVVDSLPYTNLDSIPKHLKKNILIVTQPDNLFSGKFSFLMFTIDCNTTQIPRRIHTYFNPP